MRGKKSMLRSAFQNIRNGVEVRKNLITLKELLREDATKNSHNKEALLYVIAGDYEIFESLLKHEDAKVRKNTALIMGELAAPEFLSMLFKAYQAESQMFVKSSYLAAIMNLNYESILDQLKLHYNKLCEVEITEENRKHLTEELRQLEQLLSAYSGGKAHKFTGYECANELVLLCNRNHIHITTELLGKTTKKEFTAGVMVKTKNLNDVLWIRTYREMLFAVEGVKTVPNDVVSAAKLLADGTILKYLENRHSGKSPFYFRIELKAKMDADKKSAFVKRLASEMEHLSERKLLNSVNQYEVEIRLIENKEGRFNVLLRLYTLKDSRFSYRKEAIASSIHPSTAALCAHLAKDYLQEEAQVLDPFCGVGTMLIERNFCVKAKTMYGLDLFGEAIDKARINTKEADVIINYINRDFFDFTHEYLFDEVFTNMPTVNRSMSERDLFELYRKFFNKVQQHLKQGAILVLYTHNREFVKKLGATKPFCLLKEYEISMIEGTYVEIIQYGEK